MDAETFVGIDADDDRDVSTCDARCDRLDAVLSLSELADRLQVSVQTLYDLRSQGRGPRGFRVGRHLRFRLSEIDAWLTWLEGADAERHPRGGSR